MTLSSAQAAANQLRTALLDNGVRRVSIELQQGVAGSDWGVAPFKRGMGHHIASYPPGTPGLGLVKRGRTGANALTGPLANGYGGFDLTARILTLGWANHPGAGGPWSVPSWGTVPRDNGRPYIFGWEFEGGYLPYTDEMHDFMARCGAGTLDWLGTLPGNPGPAPLECWGEHKEPWAPGRKVDRIGYTAASGRARIAAVRGTTPQEDELNNSQELLLKNAKDDAWGANQRAGDILNRVINLETNLVPGYGRRTEHSEALDIANAAALSQVLTQLSGQAIDVAALTADITRGVTERITDSITQAVTSQLLAAVTDVVRTELGADNADQADAIVDRIGVRMLGNQTPTSPAS